MILVMIVAVLVQTNHHRHRIKKKSKHSNFPSDGMMNAENGMMMISNRMGGAFGGSGMAHYPDAGMSISYNNADWSHEIPKQMMMSSGMGMSSGTQFSDLFLPVNLETAQW
jgi:hypothetical protein